MYVCSCIESLPVIAPSLELGRNNLQDSFGNVSIQSSNLHLVLVQCEPPNARDQACPAVRRNHFQQLGALSSSQYRSVLPAVSRLQTRLSPQNDSCPTNPELPARRPRRDTAPSQHLAPLPCWNGMTYFPCRCALEPTSSRWDESCFKKRQGVHCGTEKTARTSATHNEKRRVTVWVVEKTPRIFKSH